MTTVLITGLSGVGKSTTVMALRERGYTAYDADEGGLSVDRDGEWVWNIEEITRLLDAAGTEPFFLCGSASNMGRLRDRFDRIVLLSAPLELMADRMIHRTTNIHGKDPAERGIALGYKETVEPLLRRMATLEIDTRASIGDVVAAVLEHAGREACRAAAEKDGSA